ncbi:MAG TPA: monovalent cation/H(+) antiporter subunit G [Acidimicrobiales bacterium]|nr:monovalent cation/H(+) antiporter subunit G [Acidimicrobiales bacterium]
MTADIALALVSLGTAVIVLSCTGAAVIRTGTFDRVHFLTPITSIGVPLIVAGLCVTTSTALGIAWLAVLGALLAATGPVVEAAIGRRLAQLAGKVPPASPQ